METEQNDTNVELTQDEILDFYNVATFNLLTTLQDDLTLAQNSRNWRLLMSCFNMLQMIESSGIGLTIGLRFYARGKLSPKDMKSFLERHALRYEYYKNAKTLMPKYILDELEDIFMSEEYEIVKNRYNDLTKY